MKTALVVRGGTHACVGLRNKNAAGQFQGKPRIVHAALYVKDLVNLLYQKHAAILRTNAFVLMSVEHFLALNNPQLCVHVFHFAPSSQRLDAV